MTAPMLACLDRVSAASGLPIPRFTLPTRTCSLSRPERTCHVVFDREVFQRVRDEDLGRVRGQPIRPAVGGVGFAGPGVLGRERVVRVG